MSKPVIAIIDYGIGNHASVTHCLRALHYRVRITRDIATLDTADILVLPGVGAYPAAMQALQQYNLVRYIQEQAASGKPIIGICLGMQLLADASSEHQYTAGLGVIPGEFVAFPKRDCHIGWNSIKCERDDSLIADSDSKSFYFNHSFVYNGANQYVLASAYHLERIPAVIRRKNVIGIQFHPEKSQQSGRVLLKRLIAGLVDA